MFYPNSQLNFSSLRSKASLTDFINIKSSKNTGISRTVKFSELSRPTTIRDSEAADQKYKVVKLIGDKHQNIEEILLGLSCVCGCRGEFKKILNLLMGKIYRLREERNYMKQQLEMLESQKKIEMVSIGVGHNAEQERLEEQMQDELIKLIEESKVKSKSSVINTLPEVEIVPMQTDEVNDLMAINGQTSITFENEANETNLLEESPLCMKGEELSKLSFENSQSFDERILKQCDNNTENKLQNLKSYCHQRSLNLDTLQNYIEKLTCAKVLNKYQTEKRKHSIF